MSATRGFVPDLLLEQYALGELKESERIMIEAQLASDPSLRSRLAELKASDEAILAEAKPAEIAVAIRGRLASRPRLAGRRRMLPPADDRAAFGLGAAGRGTVRARRYGRAAVLLLPVAAALLVLVGAVMTRGLLFTTASDLTRPKGGAPGLSIYKKAAAGPVELRDGSPASAGDVLQIKYAAGAARYGAIFSLDGRGTITRHLPAADQTAKAPPLAPEGAALGSAYELDDAPGFERFFLLSSTTDFDLSLASEALRALAGTGTLAATGAPQLPAAIEWKSILILKKAVSR